MVLQCQDGRFYRDPSWDTPHLQITTDDDKLIVLYPKDVTPATVRRKARGLGFFFSSFHQTATRKTIWDGQWRDMFAFEGIPKKQFPKPNYAIAQSSTEFQEDGETVYKW